MANRLGRSFYRFSSVNRPAAPAAVPTSSNQDSAQYDGGRQFPSVTKDHHTAADTTSRPRSPSSPPYSPTNTRASLPTSPTYSVKKAASPPSSPSYRFNASHPITSPPKPAREYSPKFKQPHTDTSTNTHTQPRSPPEADRKPVIYKSVEKSAKHDSGKLPHSNKQQPNAVRIAGENIGAVMEIVQSPNKREGGGQGHVIKKKEARGTHNVGHETDEASKEKGHHKGKEATNSSLPTSTFMNSNFQTVNNSLLYNASLSHHDPGLHLSFSRKPTVHRSAIDEEKKHFTN